MDDQRFIEELQQRIAKYDLLCHPFYKAWSAGELTERDLREYSAQYYDHVDAFPTYLSALHYRLRDRHWRREVRATVSDAVIGGVTPAELRPDRARGRGRRGGEDRGRMQRG